MIDPIAGMKQARKAHMARLGEAMRGALNAAAELVLTEMRELTSLTDHTLEELRVLDHPYAQRHPMGTLHPDWLVHIQSEGADLHTSLFSDPSRNSREGWAVDLKSHDEKVWYLLLGTRTMRPRDFVTAALMNTERDVAAMLQRAFGSIHDRYYGFTQLTPELKPMPHENYPAQLPRDV